MIESQYNILKELGQTGDVTLDDYKNAKINQIIQGYENFAYEKENKRLRILTVVALMLMIALIGLLTTLFIQCPYIVIETFN